MNRAAWLLAFAPVAPASCLATGEDDADSAGAFSISVSAADARFGERVGEAGRVIDDRVAERCRR
jgi:hypothetical protein